MSDLYLQDAVLSEEDQAFERMMGALETPAPQVPAGLPARMQAWTMIEMEAQRSAMEAQRSAMEAQRSAMEAQRSAMERPIRTPGQTSTGESMAAARSSSFRDFGLLNTGTSNRRALLFSTAMNLAVAALVLFVAGMARQAVVSHPILTTLIAPGLKLPEVHPVPSTPREVLPKTVVQPRVEPQRVELPSDTRPVMATAAKAIVPAPALPKVTSAPAPHSVSIASAAVSRALNTPRPSAVAIGRSDSPLKSTLSGPPVSPVNLSAGLASLPAGHGNASSPTEVRLGSGQQPNHGTGDHGASPVSIAGIPGGTLPGKERGGRGATAVQIAPTQQHLSPVEKPETFSSLQQPPVVTYILKPVYSDEAKALHLEGDVALNVCLHANGSIEVMSIAHGLGHGLDEAAVQAAKGTRFRPATDARGNATDFTTLLTVHFVHN